VATIEADGFMQIADSAKGVIKSGGEWIGPIVSRSHGSKARITTMQVGLGLSVAGSRTSGA